MLSLPYFISLSLSPSSESDYIRTAWEVWNWLDSDPCMASSTKILFWPTTDLNIPQHTASCPISHLLTMADTKTEGGKDLKRREVKDMPFDNLLNFRDVGKSINQFLGQKYVLYWQLHNSGAEANHVPQSGCGREGI
jgi:hypothetical protein